MLQACRMITVWATLRADRQWMKLTGVLARKRAFRSQLIRSLIRHGKMGMTDKAVTAIIEAKKAVVFDLFHTLTSLESTWGAGRRMTCEMLGVSREAWDEQLQRKSRDRLVGSKKNAFEIVAEMARAIDPSISDERINAATENRIAPFAAALHEIPDETSTVLECLKARGKRIGLISNADVMEVAAWGQSRTGHLFDSTIFSCVAGCVKPEKEIYELSLRELGVTPAESVFVGDGGSNELEGAKNVGMTTIMITGIIIELWPDRIADRQRHADCVIERLSELVADGIGSPNHRIQVTRYPRA